ncbi:hypothetical protein HELRODRAFT_176851 [Helobdella robusta]|uniref:Uncharacterized protein n=1 Tax=Helobdella robusta TaxID=6412 RepID=T1FAZ0_HELRO|nr:hypothetical protein HELRODRAFT_176851 [Helobdella robusta]ESN98391.1 hypothetical protein HELRODRAFT_176851 [Helobdella robusta]
MKIRSGILPRLRLKLPEEFIVDDQNGCEVTLRSFIQWQRMHAWLGLKLPEEFIMEDLSDENLLFLYLSPSTRAVFQQKSRGGLAAVLEDNVGTGPHSTFCLCRMDDGGLEWIATLVR